MIRQRNRTKEALKKFEKLDAFQKVKDEYEETSIIGGTLSIVSFLIIACLVYSEATSFMNSDLVYRFKPDTEMDSKMKMHIDLTVAMKCNEMGADILDETNQQFFSFGVLSEDDTWWELCPVQQEYFEYVQSANSYLSEEYHSIAKFMFLDIIYGGRHFVSELPPRSNKPNKPHDACRIHGTLTVNKVSGNFHVSAGKSIQFPQGHIHINLLGSDSHKNFSYRINRFSFGEETIGTIHPLQGEEMVFVKDAVQRIEFYLEIVPTEIETVFSKVKTFQYSVKQKVTNVADGSSMPGIFFKYDIAALKLNVSQNRENLIQFLVRMCSVIAGIVIISSAINTVVQLLLGFVLQKSDVNYKPVNIEQVTTTNNDKS